MSYKGKTTFFSYNGPSLSTLNLENGIKIVDNVGIAAEIAAKWTLSNAVTRIYVFNGSSDMGKMEEADRVLPVGPKILARFEKCCIRKYLKR